MMEKRKSKKGFTLIELIVVIAILVVLAAIALPTFNGLIEQSKVAVAEANARTVYTAAVAYLAMNPGTENFKEKSDDARDYTAVEAYLGDGFKATIDNIVTEKVGGSGSDKDAIKSITSVTVTTDSAQGTYLNN